MANRDYDFLKYKLPTQSADFYALNAIKVLRALKRNFPKQYERSFRCPSEVLTLSGVRPLDTYYELGETITDNEITRLRDLLWGHDLVLIVQTDSGHKGYDAQKPYFLMHTSAVQDIHACYQNLPAWKPLHVSKDINDCEYLRWWYAWKESIGLVYDKPNNDIAKKLRTYPGVHDLAFGIMLGYPGPAIMSAVLDGAKLDNDTGLNATISHHDWFNGAQPNYYYTKILKYDDAIIGHQKLWSEILEKVYATLGENDYKK